MSDAEGEKTFQQVGIEFHQGIQTQQNFLGEDALANVLARKSGNAIRDRLASHRFDDQRIRTISLADEDLLLANQQVGDSFFKTSIGPVSQSCDSPKHTPMTSPTGFFPKAFQKRLQPDGPIRVRRSVAIGI